MSRRRGIAALLVPFAALVLSVVVLPVSPPASASSAGVRVGTLTLRPCHVVVGALCGSVRRPWDPHRTSLGEVRVGFAFVPARDPTGPAVGTVVPHEGGPGYSTTGTGPAYAAMYGPLLDRRNLLLVDQRGTGLSDPVDCPTLQRLHGSYAVAAAVCGARLGARAADYSTARSADDVAAVVRALRLGRVDLYGDSYGTFFTQVLAGRHPGLVRSIVLDSAYPTSGESAFYPTQGPAMRRAFALVCRRSAACRRGGTGFLPALRDVLRVVRTRPWRGVSHDADGRRMRVRVDGPSLVSVAFGATYTPAFYRELTAAMRAGLAGDHAPLLRLVAEATGGGSDAGPVAAYSEGLDAAVACHDYPQLYDLTAPPDVRQQQYAAALAARSAAHPRTYGPFSVAEYAASDWQELDWCTRWPTAPTANPAGPVAPPAAGYPDVPVLVLTGELDTITTSAEASLVAAAFPDSRRILVRNSFHVTAVGDTDDCAQRIVRRFVASPAVELPASLVGCARRVPPVRATGSFPRSVTAVGPGRAAALTVADVQDRWWNNYSGHGVGLRGGSFTYTGDRLVTFHLDRYALVPGFPVSGTAVWDRTRGSLRVDVTVPSGRLRGRWDTRAVGARGELTGRLDGRAVRYRFLAP